MNSVGDVFGDVFGEVDFKITIYAPDVDFYLCFHQNRLVGKVSFFSFYPDKGGQGGFYYFRPKTNRSSFPFFWYLFYSLEKRHKGLPLQRVNG